MLPFIALIHSPCHSLHLQASIGNYGLLYIFTFLWSWYGHICWSHNIFDSSSHTTTHIVIHSYPTPYIHSPHWLLEYHLNLGPVSAGPIYHTTPQGCRLLCYRPSSQLFGRGSSGQDCWPLPKLGDFLDCRLRGQRGSSVRSTICTIGLAFSWPLMLTFFSSSWFCTHPPESSQADSTLSLWSTSYNR